MKGKSCSEGRPVRRIPSADHVALASQRRASLYPKESRTSMSPIRSHRRNSSRSESLTRSTTYSAPLEKTRPRRNDNNMNENLPRKFMRNAEWTATTAATATATATAAVVVSSSCPLIEDDSDRRTTSRTKTMSQSAHMRGSSDRLNSRRRSFSRQDPSLNADWETSKKKFESSNEFLEPKAPKNERRGSRTKSKHSEEAAAAAAAVDFMKEVQSSKSSLSTKNTKSKTKSKSKSSDNNGKSMRRTSSVDDVALGKKKDEFGVSKNSSWTNQGTNKGDRKQRNKSSDRISRSTSTGGHLSRRKKSSRSPRQSRASESTRNAEFRVVYDNYEDTTNSSTSGDDSLDNDLDEFVGGNAQMQGKKGGSNHRKEGKEKKSSSSNKKKKKKASTKENQGNKQQKKRQEEEALPMYEPLDSPHHFCADSVVSELTEPTMVSRTRESGDRPFTTFEGAELSPAMKMIEELNTERKLREARRPSLSQQKKDFSLLEMMLANRNQQIQ